MNLNNMLTGKDNATLDLGRVGTFLGIMVFCMLSGINYAKFDPQSFGVGFGAIMAAGGAAIYFKKDTEPEPQVKQPEVQ